MTSFRVILIYMLLMTVFLPLELKASLGDASTAGEAPSPGEIVINEMQRHLVLDSYENWAPGLNWPKLRRFYAKRDFLPIWLDFEGATDRARIFRDILVDSHLEGLEPEEYHVPALQYLWRAKRSRSKARLELLLTDAFFRYSLEVSAGYKNPRAADIDWHVRPKRINVIKRLERVLVSNDIAKVLTTFPPAHKAYQQLKGKLAYYRELSKKGKWQKVDYSPQLQVGMRHRVIPQIRKRLYQEEYLDNADWTSDLFDDELDQAVRKFQTFYGHKVDGVVGYFTRKSLNIGVKSQIARIKQNMERWRWMPKNLGRRYIMVNMAGYRLDLIEGDESIMQMPVIIGKTFRATPAFIDTLEYVELNPTWKVPPRIAKEKFLPKLREDSGFLKANNLKVFDSWRKNANEVDPESIDWNEISEKRFPFKLEQTPGEHNSMGRIKFMFPNRFRVYLHDTPDRTLFDRHVRTFSSGCIRLAEPFKLADQLVSWDKPKSNPNISQQILSGETQKMSFKRRLPVYLMYWTAWVDDEGNIHFRNDIYQRNEKIATGDPIGLS